MSQQPSFILREREAIVRKPVFSERVETLLAHHLWQFQRQVRDRG